MKVLFVAPTWMATGETATALALAESVEAGGGEAWFLASSPSARIVKAKFGDRVQELTSDLALNQIRWRRMVQDIRPDVVLFTELRSLLLLRMNRQFPLADVKWLRDLQNLDASLACIDHVGSTPTLRRLMDKLNSRAILRPAASFLRPVLERMWVLLPCPLHEPGPVEGRCGVPYRSMAATASLEPEVRARVRARYLGEGRQDEDVLVFHSVPVWSYKLAKSFKVPLYDHLSSLLGWYFEDLPKRVTVVSVNNGSLLAPSPNDNVRVVNLESLPLEEFDTLLRASDLLLTENIVSFTLAKTVGHVPGVAFTNSYTLEEILQREGDGSPIRRVVMEMERQRAGSVYPHVMYPLRKPGTRAARRARGGGVMDAAVPPVPHADDVLRVGHLPSSPFLKAELYGGEETRLLLRQVLCDPEKRGTIRQEHESYRERQGRLDDGAAILKSLLGGGPRENTVLGAA